MSIMANVSAAWVLLTTLLICLDYQIMGIYLLLLLDKQTILPPWHPPSVKLAKEELLYATIF